MKAEEERLSADDAARLRETMRARFAVDPDGAFRDWYRVQRGLADAGERDVSRLLADDLWEFLASESRPRAVDEGRLWNNVGAFWGTPGPAESLERAQVCFGRALAAWEGDEEKRSRALHNFGSALAALGGTEDELRRAVSAFEEALAFRDARREIARAVTLHHLGIARRKLAERSPGSFREELSRSVDALDEGLALRRKHGLVQGAASTRFQLGVSQLALGREQEARATLAAAARELEEAGRGDEAELARRLAGER
jgi:hypothetical protein